MIKFKILIEYFFRFFVLLMPNLLIAILLRLAIKQRKDNGKDTVLYKKKSYNKTILALDSGRYRGDLDVLSKSGKFRVLHIRQGWQRLLVNSGLGRKYKVFEVKFADKNTDLYLKHNKTQSLVTSVLSKLCRFVDIDCVTTVHFKYISDYYWTVASESLNIPYIMLYRECNLMSPIIYDLVLLMMKQQQDFHGSHILVHNDKCKNVFIESNFFDEKRITVAGALRMDALVGEINMAKIKKYTKESNKKFILFYFPIDSSMFGSKGILADKYFPGSNYWDKKEEFFIKLHRTILKLASKNKNIDFIIKPKEIFMHAESWNFYKKVISESGYDVKKLDNYIVDAHADVHSLIAGSDVICGGQSSTTIESLLLGKNVILPAFCGYANTIYFDQFPWRDYTDLFDIAEDSGDFEKIFYNTINSHKKIDKRLIDRRKELFTQCFGNIAGDATSEYTKVIYNEIDKRKKTIL